ncbi:MAG: O-antigen ligase family protein [Spirochaetia bacterium]|nr:O-antigen ligase family protein [Spirochaetia bacterium]
MKSIKFEGTSEKITVYLIWAFGFFSAVSITLAEVFFIAAMACYAYGAVRNRTGFWDIFRSPVSLALAFFAVWHLVCAFAGVDAANSLKDYKKIYIILAFFLAMNALRTREDIIYAAGMTVAGTATAALYAAVTTAYNRVALGNADFRGASFSGGAMQAGGFFMMGAIATLGIIVYLAGDARKKKLPLLFYTAVFFSIMAGLLSTFTRGAWLAAIAGVIVMAWFADRKKIVLAATVGVILVSAFFARDTAVMKRLADSFHVQTGTSQMERIHMWKAGLVIIKDNPITGIGTANLEKVYPKYRQPEAREPNAGHLHNNIIQIAVIDGLPGAVILLWIFFVLWYNLYNAAGKSSNERLYMITAAAALAVATGFFINGFFEYNFLSAQAALMFWLLMGIGFAAVRNARPNAAI